MENKNFILCDLKTGDSLHGFKLLKKEYVDSHSAYMYTFEHSKTGAGLLYFARGVENKTFSVSFKTLPEDNTGVFHILEHSVLNGSRKYPVKEPFVSMLQSSMQTYLNAMTFSDKTMYPVASRNEKDFFNLMSVYLDAVFCPAIYTRPEIFMQEGWHFEYEGEGEAPYYNGVVYSEMKGVYSDVDGMIEDETNRLLYPDNCYGFSSGGHPDYITDLTYEQFTATHKRFYHPTNAKFFLDGEMDLSRVLEYIDGEYLSHYTRQEPDFDFVPQEPKTAEKTVVYEAQPGEEEQAHMVAAKILCSHEETEKLYAAKIIADYLTGSNEAPLKRAFLEAGLAQDVTLYASGGVYQPQLALVIRNTKKENFEKIKTFIPESVKAILDKGVNKEALSASLERLAFNCREISEPYGIELAMSAMDGWLYGDDPLTHINNGGVFDSLREKLATDYFEKLLSEMLSNGDDKCYLYVLPSLTKGEDDAKREDEKVRSVTADWSDEDRKNSYEAFMKMQTWQQSEDGEDVLSTLPHLDLKDISPDVKATEKSMCTVDGVPCMKVENDTNGIVYLNMYFDISDFTADELRELSLVGECFGELRTENYTAEQLQTKIKATLGSLNLKTELISKQGDIKTCKPYLMVSVSMLERNSAAATELCRELLLNGKYDEKDRIYETVLQNDYEIKQALIGNGHSFAITKALSAFSAEGAMTEMLGGESFGKWFSHMAEGFEENGSEICRRMEILANKAFAKNRMFVGYSGNMDKEALENIIASLPENRIGGVPEYPTYGSESCAVEIPSGVSYSALGSNIYALGEEYSGACAVLSSLVSYGYLWGAVRVQGGAYGTGMRIRGNGDMFCYSYRDPNVENSRSAFLAVADFVEDFVSRGMPLDDIIIGTVNTTDPLLEPGAVCALECTRYLKGTEADKIGKIRRQILSATGEDMEKLVGVLRRFAETGKFCAIGDKASVAFAAEK